MNSNPKLLVQRWAVLAAWGGTVLLARGGEAQSGLIAEACQPGDFKLVYDGQPADICSDPADEKVVAIAAGDFAEDVARVTGKNRA